MTTNAIAFRSPRKLTALRILHPLVLVLQLSPSLTFPPHGWLDIDFREGLLIEKCSLLDNFDILENYLDIWGSILNLILPLMDVGSLQNTPDTGIPFGPGEALTGLLLTGVWPLQLGDFDRSGPLRTIPGSLQTVRQAHWALGQAVNSIGSSFLRLPGHLLCIPMETWYLTSMTSTTICLITSVIHRTSCPFQSSYSAFEPQAWESPTPASRSVWVNWPAFRPVQTMMKDKTCTLIGRHSENAWQTTLFSLPRRSGTSLSFQSFHNSLRGLTKFFGGPRQIQLAK